MEKLIEQHLKDIGLAKLGDILYETKSIMAGDGTFNIILPAITGKDGTRLPLPLDIFSPNSEKIRKYFEESGYKLQSMDETPLKIWCYAKGASMASIYELREQKEDIADFVKKLELWFPFERVSYDGKKVKLPGAKYEIKKADFPYNDEKIIFATFKLLTYADCGLKVPIT